MTIAPFLNWTAVLFSVLAFLASAYVLFFAIYGRIVTKFTVPELPCSDDPTRFLVLIPAHNEEHSIAATVASLAAQKYPSDRYKVIVIADNCSDQTAQVVRGLGVETWERHNLSDRGKGQALRWALDRAEQSAFQAVVFIDADTTVDSRLLSCFDNKIKSGAQAMQARYDFELKDEQWFSILSHASKTAEAALFWTPRQHLQLASPQNASQLASQRTNQRANQQRRQFANQQRRLFELPLWHLQRDPLPGLRYDLIRDRVPLRSNIRRTFQRRRRRCA